MSTPDPREVIARSLGSMTVPGRTYPRPLPPEIAPWHCYIPDGGHSILVALDTGDLGEAPSTNALEEGSLVPAPVKSVERAGWRMVEGYVVCKLPYDPELGLVTPPEDDEYDDDTEQAPADDAATPKPTMLAVGQPYPSKIKWPDGASELRITPQGVEFLLAVSTPEKHEVNAFQKGNAEFALIPGRHHLMWAYRFANPKTGNPQAQGPGIPWTDSPWEYHRQAAAMPVAVPGERGSTFPLHLVLIDSSTGIIKGLRMVGPPVEFADALRDAVEAQASTPANDAAAGQEINALYARYPATTDLLLTAPARFEALRDGTTR
ncbi:hypothetical protein ACH4UR_37420 [Streptomyces lydicus]|uniref:hypothetical protein n=1 Tax=Streptomyces lydicus TaxID=47763 RepID=UPI0033F5F8E7